MMLRIDVQQQSMKDLFEALLAVVKKHGFSYRHGTLPERPQVCNKYSIIHGALYYYDTDTTTFS